VKSIKESESESWISMSDELESEARKLREQTQQKRQKTLGYHYRKNRCGNNTKVVRQFFNVNRMF